MTPRPRLGISACLLGDMVRYDGGHKRDSFLADVLGASVEWVRVCPEVEVGMGTPREPVQLVQDGPRIRMLTVATRIDHTDAMEAWARARVEELVSAHLSGYVFKRNSPSCGIDGVPVYDPHGSVGGRGRGLFADALMRRFPDLPVEDEGRLASPEIRDEFLRRVHEYWRRETGPLNFSGATPRKS